MYSGGICSWAAAIRVIERYGKDATTLLFADTLIEDEDLYRFMAETTLEMGIPLTRIADGRTPWQLFRDERFMGNSRVDVCSKILKRKTCDRWLEENCTREDTTIHLGLFWDEQDRFERTKSRFAERGWTADAPMCWAPWTPRLELDADLARRGIARPRLYDMGFPHNNCGGFCVKAGQGSFALLLEHMPERFAEHEREEADFRDFIGKDVAILRDRKGGQSRPLPLSELRERINQKKHDPLDLGGCGCFSETV